VKKTVDRDKEMKRRKKMRGGYPTEKKKNAGRSNWVWDTKRFGVAAKFLSRQTETNTRQKTMETHRVAGKTSGEGGRHRHMVALTETGKASKKQWQIGGR